MVECYKKEQQPKKVGKIKSMLRIGNKSKKKTEVNSELVLRKEQLFNEHVLDEIEDFENKKVENLKETLKMYTQAQINFHSKALELYTKAYACLVNEDKPPESTRNDSFGTDPVRKFDVLSNPDNTSNLEGDLDESATELQKLRIFPRRYSRRKSRRDSSVSRELMRNESIRANSLRDLDPVDMFVSSRFRLQKSNSIIDRHSIIDRQSIIDRNQPLRKRSVYFGNMGKDPLQTIFDNEAIRSGGISIHGSCHETRI